MSNFSRRRFLQLSGLTTVGFSIVAIAEGKAVSVPAQTALDIGKQAYIWGYHLVVTKRTEALQTALRAPLNQFFRVQNLVTSAGRDVVAPNNDTLYASAWLNLLE